ncbi:MAG: hypothetical protein ACPG8W_18700 [Candidatus Promineifilaceae bacterium]
MGNLTEALGWYDRRSYFATELKAAYLAEQGHTSKSLAAYRGLLHFSLDETMRTRIQHNRDILTKSS